MIILKNTGDYTIELNINRTVKSGKTIRISEKNWEKVVRSECFSHDENDCELHFHYIYAQNNGTKVFEVYSI